MKSTVSLSLPCRPQHILNLKECYKLALHPTQWLSSHTLSASLSSRNSSAHTKPSLRKSSGSRSPCLSSQGRAPSLVLTHWEHTPSSHTISTPGRGSSFWTLARGMRIEITALVLLNQNNIYLESAREQVNPLAIKSSTSIPDFTPITSTRVTRIILNSIMNITPYNSPINWRHLLTYFVSSVPSFLFCASRHRTIVQHSERDVNR